MQDVAFVSFFAEFGRRFVKGRVQETHKFELLFCNRIKKLFLVFAFFIKID